MGVFATKDFAPTDDIVDFSYQKISNQELRKRYDYRNDKGECVHNVAPYGLNLKQRGISRLGDAACTRNVASMVNDGHHPDPKHAKASNVAFHLYRSRPPTLWLRATKNIKKGEELYVDYGKKAYWSNRKEILEGHLQKRVRVSHNVPRQRNDVIVMWVDGASRGCNRGRGRAGSTGRGGTRSRGRK